MSERSKPHNGRDSAGHLRVRTADVEDLATDPAGETYLRDDVRLGGAVADIGSHAGERGEEISKLVSENRDNVKRVTKRKRA